MRYCSCPDFDVNVKYINASLQMAELHHSVYNLTPFKYCPWCGKELVEAEDKKINFIKHDGTMVEMTKEEWYTKGEGVINGGIER
jgi:hypothetical protein